jgi:Putative peptidoglycan binding domain
MADPTELPGLISKVIDAIDALNTDQSCVITIENDSSSTLQRMDLKATSGRFVDEPPRTIEPGGRAAFGSADTPGSFGTGCGGTVRYNAGGMGQADWTIKWDNPGTPILGGDNEADTELVGPEAGDYISDHFMPEKGSDKVPVRFTLTGIGAKKLEKPPPPPPGPEVERDSTCIITVVNQTKEALTLVDQGHDPDRGDFFTFPNSDIDPGEFDSFASVETEGAQVGGSKGFVQYRVGAGDTIVTLRWDNPENAQNTTDFSVDGTNPGTIAVLDQIGTGEENVPVRFTISGATGGGTIDPPEVFVEPVQEDEPTLRLGDGVNNGLDGWVEYLQSMLGQRGHPVDIDGVFGQGTLQAVRAFQTSARDTAGGKLLVDGVVGHQTWAALQEEAPRPPSTDGLPPLSHVEEGPEARWWHEGNPFYFSPDDQLIVTAVNTGNVPLGPDDFTATGIDNATQGQFELTIVDVAAPGQDLFFLATGLRDQLGPGSHSVTAFMPQELGGDNVSGTIEIVDI